MKQVVTAVYFDLDGTLVDSEVLHAQCWNDVLATFNIHYDEDEFCRQFSGKPTVEAAKVIIQSHQLEISAIALATLKNNAFSNLAVKHLPRLLEGASQIIQTCKHLGLKVALVTGSTKSEALPILLGYELYDLFDYIVTRDDVACPKPHPEPYLQAISALNEVAQNGVAIEDTHTGLSAANAAGLHTIVVPNKHSACQDITIADKQCDNLMGALDYIQKIIS